MNKKDVFLNTRQVAERIGLSVSQVRRLINSNLIKSQKIGTEYIINENDIKNIVRRKPGRRTAE